VSGTFVHRDNDVLASAAFQTMVKRHRNSEGTVGRCHAIGNLAGRLQRRFSRFAGEIEKIPERDAGDVIGFVIPPRAGLAEGSD
jgi:hypothetical protein